MWDRIKRILVAASRAGVFRNPLCFYCHSDLPEGMGEPHHTAGRGMGGGKRDDRLLIRGTDGRIYVNLALACHDCHEREQKKRLVRPVI